MKKILILNGPNLNMLGRRDPSIYGSESLPDIIARMRLHSPDIEFLDFQSNHEGDLIDHIQQAWAGEEPVDAIIINPGALAHYSHALADALRDCPLPKVEVHLSDISSREEFRRVSVTAPAVDRMISGLGADGYLHAVDYLRTHPRF